MPLEVSQPFIRRRLSEFDTQWYLKKLTLRSSDSFGEIYCRVFGEDEGIVAVHFVDKIINDGLARRIDYLFVFKTKEAEMAFLLKHGNYPQI